MGPGPQTAESSWLFHTIPYHSQVKMSVWGANLLNCKISKPNFGTKPLANWSPNDLVPIMSMSNLWGMTWWSHGYRMSSRRGEHLPYASSSTWWKVMSSALSLPVESPQSLKAWALKPVPIRFMVDGSAPGVPRLLLEQLRSSFVELDPTDGLHARLRVQWVQQGVDHLGTTMTWKHFPGRYGEPKEQEKVESGILSLMALVRNDYEAEYGTWEWHQMTSTGTQRLGCFHYFSFTDQWPEVVCASRVVSGVSWSSHMSPSRPLQHRRRGPTDYPPLSGNNCKECWNGPNLRQSFLVMHILGKALWNWRLWPWPEKRNLLLDTEIGFLLDDGFGGALGLTSSKASPCTEEGCSCNLAFGGPSHWQVQAVACTAWVQSFSDMISSTIGRSTPTPSSSLWAVCWGVACSLTFCDRSVTSQIPSAHQRPDQAVRYVLVAWIMTCQTAASVPPIWERDRKDTEVWQSLRKFDKLLDMVRSN